VAAVDYTLHTNSTQNTENGTYITIKIYITYITIKNTDKP
jgi:hypothetical protein